MYLLNGPYSYSGELRPLVPFNVGVYQEYAPMRHQITKRKKRVDGISRPGEVGCTDLHPILMVTGGVICENEYVIETFACARYRICDFTFRGTLMKVTPLSDFLRLTVIISPHVLVRTKVTPVGLFPNGGKCK